MPVANARTSHISPIRPWPWIGLFVAAIIVYYIAMAILGGLINGNGAPFLGEISPSSQPASPLR
jgi:hypothetical protein